jgi:hypothetical protein
MGVNAQINKIPGKALDLYFALLQHVVLFCLQWPLSTSSCSLGRQQWSVQTLALLDAYNPPK